MFCQNHNFIADIEERHHGPHLMQCTTPSQPFEFLLKELVSFVHEELNMQSTVTLTPSNLHELEAISYSRSIRRFRSSYEVYHHHHRRPSFKEALSDSDSESNNAEDEGPTTEDEDPAAGTRVLLRGTKAPSSRSVPEPERPERVSALRQPTLTTWIDTEDGIAYINVPAYPPPAPPVQTLPSPEWSFGSLPVSPAPSIVPSPVSSPMIPLTVPSLVASPATAKTEGFLTEDIALESLADHTDVQRSAMWHAISDTQRENQELRLKIVEERRAH
ncbi:hypothetical protein Tco_0733749 [Tanacetum coccineum]